MAQEVRIVDLLPHEDQVSRGHELRDEGAAVGRTRERVGPDAEPAVVVAVVVLPELFFLLDNRVVEDGMPALHPGQGSDGSRARQEPNWKAGRARAGRRAPAGLPLRLWAWARSELRSDGALRVVVEQLDLQLVAGMLLLH